MTCTLRVSGSSPSYLTRQTCLLPVCSFFWQNFCHADPVSTPAAGTPSGVGVAAGAAGAAIGTFVFGTGWPSCATAKDVPSANASASKLDEPMWLSVSPRINIFTSICALFSGCDLQCLDDFNLKCGADMTPSR